MHLIFFVRGVIPALNQFEQFMMCQMFPWKRINLKTGKEEIVNVQGALRRLPFGFYEYVFPEDSLTEVQAMLGLYDGTDDYYNKDFGLWKIAFLRKMMGGVLPLPKISPETKTWRFIPKLGVVIYPVGIKYDKVAEAEAWGYKQEML